MKRALLLLTAVACDFSPGSWRANDAGVDSEIDAIDVNPPAWTIDTTSGRATPRDAQEWEKLAAASSLPIRPPNALWTLQETSGTLADQIGTTVLKPNGGVRYAEPTLGWSRSAIATTGGNIGARFFNTSDPALPDVSTDSMLILLYYATVSAPAQTSNIVFAGCCSTSALARVDVTTSSQLSVTIGSTSIIGSATYGADAVPIVLQLDNTNDAQRVVTPFETIDVPTTALQSSRGIFIGSAGAPAPEGRWLYMVAWYGIDAEMTPATIASLLDALGW